MFSKDIGICFGDKGFRVQSREQYLLERLKVQFLYGQREVLLDYAGLSRDNLIMAFFQHGVLDNGFNVVSNYLPRFKAPRGDFGRRLPFLVYSQETRDTLNDFGQEAIAVGAPYLYVTKLKDLREKRIKPRSETLVFPRHSTQNQSVSPTLNDALAMIKLWRRLAKSEIVICLYWIDYIDTVWQEASRLSQVEIVSVGISETSPPWGAHNLRTRFLHSLSELLDGFDRILANDVLSVIFYALYEGKEVGIFPYDSKVIGDNRNYESIYWERLNEILPGCVGKFNNPADYQGNIRALLGFESLMSREMLMKSLPIEKINLLST